MPSSKKLSERSDATLGDILSNPNRKVTPADLASAGIVESYSTIIEWERKGWLPEAYRLPNGQKIWLGHQIAPVVQRRSGPSETPDQEAANGPVTELAASGDDEASTNALADPDSDQAAV